MKRCCAASTPGEMLDLPRTERYRVYDREIERYDCERQQYNPVASRFHGNIVHQNIQRQRISIPGMKDLEPKKVGKQRDLEGKRTDAITGILPLLMLQKAFGDIGEPG